MRARLLSGSLVALAILFAASAAGARENDDRPTQGRQKKRAFHLSRLFDLPASELTSTIAEPLADPGEIEPGRYQLSGDPGDSFNLALFVESNDVDAQRAMVRWTLPPGKNAAPYLFASGGTHTMGGHRLLTPIAVAEQVPSFYEVAFDRQYRPLPTTTAVVGVGMDFRGRAADTGTAVGAAAFLVGIIAGGRAR